MVSSTGIVVSGSGRQESARYVGGPWGIPKLGVRYKGGGEHGRNGRRGVGGCIADVSVEGAGGRRLEELASGVCLRGWVPGRQLGRSVWHGPGGEDWGLSGVTAL